MDLTEFKSAFNGGTRANRFLVMGDFLNGPTVTRKHSFHVRSTFIPAVPQMVLEMNSFGRKLYIPGDREYLPWSITVYDDHSITEETGDNPRKLWEQFTKWQDGINRHTTNDTSIAAFPHLNYKQNWTVQQLNLNGDAVIKEFKLIGCWPRSVGQIEFNMTRRNFLNTFSVVMSYDEIEITGGAFPPPSGS